MANDSVSQAVSQIGAAVSLQVTAPGNAEDAELPPVKFDRLGIERRVLAFITDETNVQALGPRNTLAALTFDLMSDRNTTHPPATHGRLHVDGKSVEEIAQQVLEHLEALKREGLVNQRADGSYSVTKAGRTELAS